MDVNINYESDFPIEIKFNGESVHCLTKHDAKILFKKLAKALYNINEDEPLGNEQKPMWIECVERMPEEHESMVRHHVDP